ncbi:MAG: UDP-N-acetylglucosamine 1-carboxyvinyltransferase [Planctomycetaceae bacterium]|nr:UDP-N-acetylglucosamine 1-carboxyvinyltransferase [Planctomycetaceae bacterium]MCB9951765.1 UDP-N-acetylglucosamine 1-carboxyvinyltransferase [Planctomycetaceae bacterium]
MDMFVVQGGRSLSGSLRVSGSKNASLPIMAATLAVDGVVNLANVPNLADVRTLARLLEQLGMHVHRSDGGGLRLQTISASTSVADYDLVRTMRASVCVLGPLLARRGWACVSLPGGCQIGHRPIDLHLRGLAALGAELWTERGYVFGRCSRLRGARIPLSGVQGSTVTGTCNVLSAAVLAEGTTVIEGAACEPEVVDLANFLNACGARITGQGTPELTIDGVDALHGCDYEVIPDRIEAATLLTAAAMTRGTLSLSGVVAEHLEVVLQVLRDVGARIELEEDSIRLTGPDVIQPAEVTAVPYPGFPTDTQAQLMALLSLAKGRSVVKDCVFPDRFLHVSELCRLGAKIQREGNTALIEGVPYLSGANVMASDLRASAALVLAAVAARDESTIRRIYHLDRGYEQLECKLNQLGASVTRTVDAPQNIPLPLQPSTLIPPGIKRPA